MESLMGSETAGKVLTKDSACPSLTVKQRFWGFISCFCLGCLISFLSVGGIFALGMNPVKFAMLYSIGNLSSLGSTFFLIGPMRQLKRMFNKTRAVASIMFIGALIGTIAMAIIYEKGVKWQRLVLLILVALQFCALFWYTLSYIPFGRKIFKKICGSICCPDDEDSKGSDTPKK